MNLVKELNKFQKESGATTEVYSPIDAISIWGLGCWDEGGEVGGLFKKYIGHGEKLNQVDLMKEEGDSLWYAARVADWLGVELGTVWDNAKILYYTNCCPPNKYAVPMLKFQRSPLPSKKGNQELNVVYN
jgi:hypothetical protein